MPREEYSYFPDYSRELTIDFEHLVDLPQGIMRPGVHVHELTSVSEPEATTIRFIPYIYFDSSRHIIGSQIRDNLVKKVVPCTPISVIPRKEVGLGF